MDETPAVIEQLQDRIEAKAQRLINRYGFAEQDRDDIEQELWVGLLTFRRLSRVNGDCPVCAAVARNDALEQIVEHTIASILRYGSTSYPTTRRWYPLLDGLAYAEADRYVMRAQLRLDVDQVLAELPAELTALAERLMFLPLTDALPDDNASSSVTTAQLGELRGAFAVAGFDRLF